MKIHYGLSILLGMLLVLGASTSAQAQHTIAFVDADAVLKAMPAYRSTRKDLEIFQEQLVKELETEKRKIAEYYTQVIEQVKRGELTPKQQQEAEAKLQDLQKALQTKTTMADQRLSDREQSLSKPMYDAFEKAIETMARKNGYAYVMDKNFISYGQKAVDATEKVKKELGL